MYTNLKVGDKIIRFQIDSGAGVNVIPKCVVLDNVELQSNDNLKLEMLNNSTAKPVGKCRLTVKKRKKKKKKKKKKKEKGKENSKKYSFEFVVVSENFMSLLGKHASEQMIFITVNHDNLYALQNKRKKKEKKKKEDTVSDVFHKYFDVLRMK